MDVLKTFKKNKLLKDLTTFGIGGFAKYFISVDSIPKMKEVLKYTHKNSLPFFILGKGSNVIFDDNGFDGLIILNKINFHAFTTDSVYVGAGYSFSLLASQYTKRNFFGLEFAYGIPGSVGGAIFMNAGANGQETSNVLKEVLFLNFKGESIIYKRDEIDFGYRFSSFQKKTGVICSAKFGFSSEQINDQYKIFSHRLKTQPYNTKNAGCIFRNPQGPYSAGYLIEKCGLKGKKIGQAVVSDVHANFIVNENQAKAKDVLDLISLIQETVLKKTGVFLEKELNYIPYTSKETNGI
jgi:UDP-N-acetylmuramate dehydrogenase